MNFFTDYFTVAQFAELKNESIKYARNSLNRLEKHAEAESITCRRENSLRTYKMYRLLK